MAAIVVPFRGAGAKLRLVELAPGARRRVALAMLADVLAAATATGATLLVTEDDAAAQLAAAAGARTLADPGSGQGGAVEAAFAALEPGAALVVNADLPCVTAEDLEALAEAIPDGGLALASARDGTTNALGLSGPELFAPVYGKGSAARFWARATSLGVAVVEVSRPNLADDVDTVADLGRVGPRAGRHTAAALAALTAVLAA